MLDALFSFSGAISRRAYVSIALFGVLLKHVLDLVVANFLFHHEWSPLNYLIPLGIPTPLSGVQSGDRFFILSMLTLALPFAWVGTAITVKRFRTIGWPTWMALLFFVPVANIVSFAVAAAWPESSETHEDTPPPWLARFVPSDLLGSAMVALLVTALLGIGLVALGTRALNTYGWGLFAAIPFGQGALAAILFGVRRPRSLRESLGIALFSVLLTAVGLLAVALEGAVCIVMATPIALAFACLGGLFGHVAQQGRRPPHADIAVLLICTLIAPAIMGAEAVVPRHAPIYRVESSITIHATPMQVWKHVIRFPDLVPPTQLPFLLGIAYPERAEIIGTGVGAIRYCEFSTGKFVEPITMWEPGRELAFNVTHSPEPMREFSPYPGLDTAHLHGYMVSRHGEFLLEPMSGGRTRLIGITWYQHHLWPASYWAIFSNQIVHQIHMRVLKHIKTISEESSQKIGQLVDRRH